MDKEGKIQRAATVGETDFLLQWGHRKRLRCLKVKEESNVTEKFNGVIRKKITSRIDRRVIRTVKETASLVPLNSQHKNSDGLKSPSRNDNQKSGSGSPEKEERYYTTRGSTLGIEENGKNLMMETRVEDRAGGNVWPRLLISLSNKEKEEDFLAMKGCKLPQRPKKRAKLVQRTLLLVSPGAWLSDLCQERYEVREKKTSKKRPRGLKAMGSMASDSE